VLAKSNQDANLHLTYSDCSQFSNGCGVKSVHFRKKISAQDISFIVASLQN